MQIVADRAHDNAFAREIGMRRFDIRGGEPERHHARRGAFLICRKRDRDASLRQRERHSPSIFALAIIRYNCETERVRIKYLRLRHVSDAYREHLQFSNHLHTAHSCVSPVKIH